MLWQSGRLSSISRGKICLAYGLMALCCFLHVRSSAPVVVPSVSSASIALPADHLLYIGVDWLIDGRLIRVESVGALPAFPLWERLSASSAAGVSTWGLSCHMHHAGGRTSNSAAPLVGAFPSGSVPCSCCGRQGVAVIWIGAGRLSSGGGSCAWGLVPTSPGVRLPSGQGLTRLRWRLMC